LSRATPRLPRWTRQWWLWFALLFLIVFYGFWPSFFSALAEAEAPYVVHGFSASGWMILAVVQAQLLRRPRHRRLHHVLGYGAIALALVVVASGLEMLRIMVARPEAPLLDFVFFYIDLTALALFVLFLALAVAAARRRDIALHLRLIACTAILPLEAALERVAGNSFPALVPNYTIALQVSLVTLELLLASLILLELRYGRLRWPFPVLLGYYLVSHASMYPVASSEWFHAFAAAYVALLS